MAETNNKVHQNRHSFHIVEPSPWPVATSFSSLMMLIGFVMVLHNVRYGLFYSITGMCLLLFCMFDWWQDVITEGTYYLDHTIKTVKGFKIGMSLFIASEVMFFFAFFWAFFNSCLNPTIVLGCIWPPLGIKTFNPFEIPLLNTLILLTSGVWVTYCHKLLLNSCFLRDIKRSLLVTIFLGVFFTILQTFEYIHSPFNISDSVYGSTFFLTTGFHGLHVLIGTIFLIVCYKRFSNKHLTSKRHVSFELAVWYWHFVDVVWVFLYITIYIWGSSI